MKAAILALAVALAACHNLAPHTPATPFASFPKKRWLAGDPLPVYTAWYAKCTRKTVALDKSYDKEEDDAISTRLMLGILLPPLLPVVLLTVLHWEKSEVTCNGQTYVVEASCSSACKIARAKQQQEGEVLVTVADAGPTTITLSLVNGAHKHAVRGDVLFLDPAHIELQCFDPRTRDYGSCERVTLDPDAPRVRVVIDGKPLSATVQHQTIDIVLDGEPDHSDLSLDDVLGVRPLPLGSYDLQLRVRSASYTRPLFVQRRVMVAQR